MPSPLCRCRTLYIGSAVPTVTKDGLEGIQEPLRERYPVSQALDTRGIDSWLSVWSNGLLLEYVQDAKEESRFFPIASLHYCAAVRYVNVQGFQVEGGGERFLPLDSPFAQAPSGEPPIFAAILRRTAGIKVLECHAFICTNAKAANALVASCFRAYADSVQVKVPPSLAVTGDEAPTNQEVDTIARRNGQPKPIRDRGSSRGSSPEKDNGYVRDDESGSDREILRWPENEPINGKTAWQRRQQAGDIDAASISSSLAGRYRKRERLPPQAATLGRHPRTRSELGGAHPSLPHPARGRQPLPLHYRRSNSDADLLASSATLPRRPPPHLLHPHFQGGPPPPPHMMPPMMMGPPGAMMMGPPGHPPPHMMPPPHMVPPHVMYGDFGPPPPHMMGPPPPPGHMPPPPPHLMGGTMSKSTMGRSARGPIIEEPVYMGGSVMGPMGGPEPPPSSFNPATLQREAAQREERQSYAESRAEGEWGDYDGPWDSPVYQSRNTFRRQPYLNERAFGMGGMERFAQRPPSPPVDYDRPRHNTASVY